MTLQGASVSPSKDLIRKDYKGVLWAASQTPGIYRLDFNAADFTVSSLGVLRMMKSPLKRPDFVAEYIDTFISNLSWLLKTRFRSSRVGIEPHVLLKV